MSNTKSWYDHRDDLLATGLVEKVGDAGNSPLYAINEDPRYEALRILEDLAEVSEESASVPEGVQSLSDLELMVGADDLTVPADAVGRDDEEVRAAGLDVPEGAKVLLNVLHSEGGPVTEAHGLATDADDDVLNVSRRTVSNWIDKLVEAGALVEGNYRQRKGRKYRVR